jgi:hypothetical protein
LLIFSLNLPEHLKVTTLRAGSDIFIVMVKTPPAGNSAYPVVVATDQLK